MKYLLIFLLPFSVYASAVDQTLKALGETETARTIKSNVEKKAKKYELHNLAPLALLIQKKIKIGNVVVDLKNKSVGVAWTF